MQRMTEVCTNMQKRNRIQVKGLLTNRKTEEGHQENNMRNGSENVKNAGRN